MEELKIVSKEEAINFWKSEQRGCILKLYEDGTDSYLESLEEVEKWDGEFLLEIEE